MTVHSGNTAIAQVSKTTRASFMNQDERAQMFLAIRERLAPPATGVWFHELALKATKAGTSHWKLQGTPIVSPEYCRLIGRQSEAELPQDRLGVVDGPHRRAVRQKIYYAIQDPDGNTHECTFRVKLPESQGRRTIRWILARAGRIELNGKTYLACWNTDITTLREKETFYETVLTTVPGFVFMKEFDPHMEGGGGFRFKYCNERLREELRGCLESTTDLRRSDDFYIDKTDFDFFPHEQAENFRRNDLMAFHQAGGKQVTIAEEQFTPRCSIPSSKTLTTVKVRFDTLNFDGSRSECVLGVAIDLSAMMQLLRAAVDACRDAVFIKDAEHRYVYVNRTFRSFLGVEKELVIEGKTFLDVQKSRYGDSFPYGLRELATQIEVDDMQLLSKGDPITRERLAFYSDKKLWQLEKRRIGVSKDVFHVIGVARHKLDPERINTQIIKNSPQYICIKDANLRVIHCNWNFAQRRHRSIEECFGKTDAEFWPEERFPGQAKRFQDRDREVLALLPILESLERDTGISDGEKHKHRREILRKHTSYEELCEIEERLPDGTSRIATRHIVTTKWPDRLNGDPVIHVLYADDTDAKIQLREAASNLETWHRYTIHAIGNETTPFMGALLEAKRLLSSQVAVTNPDLRECLQSIHNKLVFGKHGMDFYVNNHLKFISGNCDLSHEVSIGAMVAIKLQEFVDIHVDYAEFQNCDIEKATIDQNVRADAVFLKAAITEMLRNALKSSERRYGDGYRLSTETSRKGAIRVTCRLRENAGRIKQECIVISVQDNGDGCVPGSEAQEKLRAAFGRAYSEKFNHSHEFGLRFLHSVARGHQGALSLNTKPDQPVEFHLVIPTKQSARTF